MKTVDEITRNNSQVHAVSWRFGNWGVGNVVPLQREKFKGVNAEDWPYTTKAPENDNGNVCSPLWGVGGGWIDMLKYQIYQSQLKDSPSFGKFYARIISDGTVDVKGLAEHMAKHNTPFSPGTITGIITDAIAYHIL